MIVLTMIYFGGILHLVQTSPPVRGMRMRPRDPHQSATKDDRSDIVASVPIDCAMKG